MSIKVIFLPHAFDKFDNYIRLFQGFYTEMYSDTGIWSEDYIIAEYINKSEYLSDVIVDTVTAKMSVGLVPYEQSGDKKISVFVIENRRLRVTYTESDTEGVIEDIEIQYR